MSDPTLPIDQDLGQLVMQAPEPVWRKIRKALSVESREEAAALVQADPKAQEVVLEILGGGGDTMLTDRRGGGGKAPGSLVTDGAPAAAPLSERMYGGSSGKKGQVKF